MNPLQSVQSPLELGQWVRKVRKRQGLRQDEIARFAQTFVGEVEKGKLTAEVGMLFEMLQELGMRVYIEVPPGAFDDR
jgi:HTH-type transcriptional regulator/antitoxin HipB